MIVNVLDIIHDRIEQAVEEQDLERERALHCLHSQLITASQDAGFDKPVALRHIDEWDKPIEEECKIFERYGRVPVNSSPEEMEQLEPLYVDILKAIAAGDSRKINQIIREIASHLINPYSLGE